MKMANYLFSGPRIVGLAGRCHPSPVVTDTCAFGPIC